MTEKAALCLSTGSLEFWLVDPQRRVVNVTRQGGDSASYGLGERIPLLLFGGALNVDEIFAL